MHINMCVYIYVYIHVYKRDQKVIPINLKDNFRFHLGFQIQFQTNKMLCDTAE